MLNMARRFTSINSFLRTVKYPICLRAGIRIESVLTGNWAYFPEQEPGSVLGAGAGAGAVRNFPGSVAEIYTYIKLENAHIL